MKTVLAITILVGGSFMMADLVQAQTAGRSGEQIVKMQCVKCHGSGVNGAPKIDDRAAWAPRMRQGLQVTVASAIKGHGKMPARGGVADLTDAELRAAILYMFYPAAASNTPSAAAAALPPDPRHKVADDMEVFLGVAPAGAKGIYHINLSLRDAASQAQIKDAVVEVRVANLLGGATKKLEAREFNGAPAYVNDFRMEGAYPYTVTAQIHRAGAARPTEVSFEFRP
jgi:cytochrome c5